MAVTLDAVGSGSVSVSSALTLTFSHTCTGANYIAVGATVTGDSITGITYAGVALAIVAGTGSFAVWGLTNPAAGANNVVVTFASSALKNGIAGSTSYKGVSTQNPTSATTYSAAGFDSLPTVPTSGDTIGSMFFSTLTIDISSGASSLFGTAPTTRKWSIKSADSLLRGGGGTTPTSSTTQSIDYTLSADADWQLLAIEILPSLSGSPTQLLGGTRYTVPSIDTPTTGKGEPVPPAGLTINHSVGTGNNRYLLICLSEQGSDITDTFTDNAVDILGGNNFAQAVVNVGTTLIYGFLNPASGLHTITWNGLVTRRVILSAISFANIDQNNPTIGLLTATGSSVLPTITLTGKINGIAFAAGTITTGQTPTINQGISQWKQAQGSGASGTAGVGSTRVLTTTSATLAWNITTTTWGMNGVILRPVA